MKPCPTFAARVVQLQPAYFVAFAYLGELMSFKIGGRPGDGNDAASAVEHGAHGGRFATILSGVALVISGMSYYESALKTADLSVFVPPMIHYARDGRDVFNVPITISNEGARTGTVLSMELDVEKIGGGGDIQHRKFHAAFLGEYPQGEEKVPTRSFAPLAIQGHSSFTETVRFYPMDNADGVLVDDKGDFRFTLTLQTAQSGQPDLLEKALRSDPKRIVFELNLPYLAVQHLSFRNGTQAMFNKNWKSATSFDAAAPATEAPAPEAVPPAEPATPQAPPDRKTETAPAPEKKAEVPPEKKGEAAAAKPAQKIEIIPETPTAPPPADPKTAGGAAAKAAAQPQKR